MQILMGALAAAVLALGLMGWQLKNAWDDTANARQSALQAEQAAGEQRQQAELLLGRLTALDTALTRLETGTQANTHLLGQTLLGIENIQPTAGDHPDAQKCLDVRVPAQLADRVR